MSQEPKKFIAPRNQKAVYNSFALVFEAIANDEITGEKGLAMTKALSGMNTAFGIEARLKIAAGNVVPRPGIEMTTFPETVDSHQSL